MKNFIFILLLVGFTIIVVRQCRTNQSLKKENDLYKTASSFATSKNVVIDTIIDTVEGQTIIKYIPIETKQNLTDYVSKSVADTLAQALKIAVKDIKSWKSYAMALNDTISGLRFKDEQGQQWATLKDKTFDIKYNIDSNIWNLGISIDNKLITYRARKSIFQPYRYYSAISASDERIKFSNVKDVSYVKTPSRWGIGFNAGPIFTPSGLTYGVGFGLTYDLIPF
ncbi:hypothetical protein ACR79T_10245 [Sphingobacterium spiritivorum]|uniref:hypothetical protein n=1 Tax=Sphingobacterium spiritivorum TaxID=258 RepID=UPI003DA1CC4F